MYNDDNMNDIIEQKIKSLSEEYDKVYLEYQEKLKRLEEIVAQHKVLNDIKNGVEETVKAGEVIIVKDKKNG